jgi:cob(I)alamin adenosyltransferase
LKIYTKTGDDGTTGLQGKKRVSKSNKRIIAYGSVDEVNSILGIILSYGVDSDLSQLLTKIQNDLFVAGADLSKPNLGDSTNRITSNMIKFLEGKIDGFEKELESLTNFILPGGNHVASLIHFARTVTRRAEIEVVTLSEEEKINKLCLTYLNRLSDLLFVIGRVVNKRNNTPDIIWKPEN